MKRYIVILLLLMGVCGARSGQAADSTVTTLWPLLDDRAAPSADYRSLHLLGPLLKYETKGLETEYAVRPLFYRATDSEGVSQTDLFYPLFGYKREQDATSFHLFHLLNYDFGRRESGSRNRFYLFPLLFYGEEEQGRYAALFPFGGTLYHWFGRDRISFALFPLYGRTERAATRIDNVLWPFFARISGEDESGFKLWPLYGQSSKRGVYSKRFFLWPFFFRESIGLDGDNPTESVGALPFYYARESRQESYRAVAWPFFSWQEDRVRGYQAWNAPWPLVRVMRGESWHGLRLLPLFADETMDVRRQRWYLWPIYKIEEMNTELISRHRERVLFFLYSDVREEKWETGDSLRRIDLWPLFGYQRRGGVSHLHLFSLVEPFFPGNQAIERLWAPLWRVYQQKWDARGNRVASLLWNFFWYERRGDTVAWELFPLLGYRAGAKEQEISLLKGLVRYRRDGTDAQLSLFFLPLGPRWGVAREVE
jgi:hypothetical protein